MYNKGYCHYIIELLQTSIWKILSLKKELKALLKACKVLRKYKWLAWNIRSNVFCKRSLINPDKAHTRFFNKKGATQDLKTSIIEKVSITYSGSIGCGENSVKIGKLKTQVKARIYRRIKVRVTSITISKNLIGKYYVLIIFQITVIRMLRVLRLLRRVSLLVSILD